MRPFAHRKYDPNSKDRFMFWRWYEILVDFSRTDSPVYLRRLLLMRCPLFSAMVHRIYGPDPGRELHDHPWWFISFILWGAYTEETVLPSGIACFRLRRWLSMHRATDAHRITGVTKNLWTFVITGPKKRTWGFYTKHGWVQWRDYSPSS